MPIALDFETFWSKQRKYTVRMTVPEHYCSNPLFDAYMVSVCDGKQCWAGHPKDFNWSAIHGETVIAHNARFDSAVFLELQKRGVVSKSIQPKTWMCSADLTAYLSGRRALDHAMEFLLKIQVSKAVRASSENKHWPEDFSASERAAMLNYAKYDAFYCWSLWDKFSAQWPSVEQRLSELTRIQGNRGVLINADLLEKYIVEIHEAKMTTEKLLPWLEDTWDEDEEFDNYKPTSTKCIAEQCRRVGIPCPPVQKEDEEGFEEWERTHSPRHPWIPALSSWRSLNQQYRKLLRTKERLRDEGTLPFSLKYFGAHTGRWSGEGGINFQNFRKEPILIRKDGLMECDPKRIAAALDQVEVIGSYPDWVKSDMDYRRLVIPRAGKKMIVSDLSQIEPRVLAWLSGDMAFLDMVRSGVSVYEAHARQTMGWTGGVLRDENPALYKLAKARILGLGYGCGWQKFISMAWTLARLDITKDDPEFINVTDPVTNLVTVLPGYGQFSKKCVEDFRRNNQKLAGEGGIWQKLDVGLRRSVATYFDVTLPNGRRMRYENVRHERRIEPDRQTGRPTKRSVFTAEVQGIRKIFHGPKLTENVTQAAARDVFGEQILRLESGSVHNLFGVHDEAVLECDMDVTTKDIEAEMSYCPDWLKGCPVKAKAKEVPCYTK